MFRAIDPDGLVELADQLVLRATIVRRAALAASTVLSRHAREAIAINLLATERWAGERAADLRWRAETISLGQQRSFSLPALLRAEFAATGVFAPGEQNTAFATWLRKGDLSQQAVASAIARIGEWLEQEWLDWDVTNRDLHNIKTTLQSLSGTELERVIAALSPRQLERWITEMGHSLNGFSRAEKQEVFELIAENSSGDTLRRIHDALLSSGERTDLLDLGGAIQVHSPDAVIADFVAEVLAGELADRRFSLLAPGRAIQGLQDPEATGRAAGAIFEHRGALPWLIADFTAVGEDPARLVAALILPTNDEQTAAGFVSALNLLGAPGELDRMIASRHSDDRLSDDHVAHSVLEEAEEHLLSTTVRFLAAAPDEVFTQLATIADPEGHLTSAFWHHLVRRGDAGSIATALEGLRGGAAVDLDRFASRGTDPDYEYPYARNLAFAAATLNRGLSQSAQEAHSDIAVIGRVADVTITVVGLLSGGSAVAESLAGTGAGWTVERHATAVKDDLDSQLAGLFDTVTARLRPPDGANLAQFPDAGNALLAWTGVYTRLLPHA